MPTYNAPLRDMRFVLDELFGSTEPGRGAARLRGATPD